MQDDQNVSDETDPAEAETVNLGRSSLLAADLQLSFAGTTHVGLVRRNNEDQYLIVHVRKSLEILESSLVSTDLPFLPDQEGYVLLVADGIGGRAGGERASTLVVQEAAHYMLGAAKWFFHLDDPDEHVRLRLLRDALNRIDRQIIEAGEEDPTLAGMGTTLTAASIIGNGVFIVHVGDSRAYLLHDGELEQLTTDHTISQDLVNYGLISPEQAKTHKLHNVLTNALGGKPGVAADFIKVRLAAGDRLLLCTDGLSELVADARIAEILRLKPHPQDACQALLDAALSAGGLDNITIVVAAAD